MLLYTVTPLPPVWPGQRHAQPEPSRFKANWGRSLDLLESEIEKLNGSEVEFAIELPRGARDINNNGTLRADARPGRAVIVSFRVTDGTRMQFPSDQYDWWQDNVHAVALTLESLRAIDRWGVSQAKHYQGFKALPSQTAPTMGVEQASLAIESHSPYSAQQITADVSVAKNAVRAAIHRTHPDRNDGVRTAYDRVDEARKVLSSHHGVSL